MDHKSRLSQISVADDQRNYDLFLASSLKVSSSPKCELDATAVKLQKMAYSMLLDINPSSEHWKICVKLSRLWEYRGNVDSGSVQHLDPLCIFYYFLLPSFLYSCSATLN